MARATIDVGSIFSVGTTVGAYPVASKRPGIPAGAGAVETASVAANGLVTFDELTSAGPVWTAAAQVNSVWRYVDFTALADTDDIVLESSLPITVTDADYGAVADNVAGGANGTSSSAAIQTAINAASARYVATGAEQSVIVPSGRYYTPSIFPYELYSGAAFGRYPAMVLKAGVHLVGVGRPVFYNPFNSSGDAESGETTIMCGTTGIASNWSVRGIVFESNATVGATEKNSDTISLAQGHDWEVADCEFHHQRGDGVVVVSILATGGCKRWRVRDNYFHDMCGNEIIVYSGSGSANALDDWRVTGNRIKNNLAGAESLAVNGSAYRGLVQGNTWDGTGNCVFGVDTQKVQFVDNEWKGQVGQTGAGVGVLGGSDVVIARNVIDVSLQTVAAGGDGGTNAVNCTTNVVKGLLIDGNTIKGGGGIPIVLNTSDLDTFDDVVIRGNRIVTTDASPADAGTVALKFCKDPVVEGNVCSGTADSSIVVQGSSTGVATIVGNKVQNGRIVSGAEAIVCGNRVRDVPADTACLTLTNGGTVTGNRFQSARTISMIEVSGSTNRTLIVGNSFENTSGSGVYYVDGAANDVTVRGNAFKGTLSLGADGSGVNLTGTGCVHETARNGGSASKQNGSTIAHGLPVAPTRVTVTPSVAKREVAVTTVGATTFTIALHDDTGTAVASNETVYWEAVL